MADHDDSADWGDDFDEELPTFQRDAAGSLNDDLKEVSERARANADEGDAMGGAQRGAQCRHPRARV